MSLYTKKDLIYKEYKWSAYPENDPKVSGDLDNTAFNRNEGNEVLYLINTFMEKHGLKEKASGKIIEKMLHSDLPDSVYSQSEAKDWIRQNWNRY